MTRIFGGEVDVATSSNSQAQRRRELSRRRALGVGALGAGSAAFLAACGGGSNTSPENVTRDATIPAQNRQAETGQPKPGGTLNVIQRANAPLDPHLNSTFTAQTLAGYVQARLLKFKTGPNPDVAASYEIEGDLAESVETTPDGMTVTYKLRPNAKFQDIAPVSGRVVDSEDVSFSFERFRTDPKSTNRAVFGSQQNPLVDKVETPDARTVVVKLVKPYGPFRNLTASPNFLWIMAKEIGTGRLDPSKQAIGAGPFILDQVQPDIAYRLKKHPGYYGAPMPYVDGVNINNIAEEAQDIAQFQAGRVDAIINMPAERVEEVKKSTPKAQFIEYMPTTFSFIAFQQRGQTPFRDERVRRAAAMAVDRDALIDLIYLGKGTWLSAIPANFGKWRVDPKSTDFGAGGQWYKHNPAESKKLLAAAGYPNGMPLRYIYTNNIYGERFNQAAEAVAGMLKEGGFQVQVVIQDYLREYITPGTGTFFGNFEGVFYGLSTSFSDPHDYLFNMYHSKSTRNHAGVSDPQLDALIDKEEATLSDDERVKLVKEIQRYLGDKVYYSPGAVGPAVIAAQEWIKNYQPSNGGYGIGTETQAKLWIDRG
jgi:peptide/nickel transport system substrate-binding protein